MTYTKATQTTYKQMFRDVRDELEALAGWSIVVDALDGSDYFVLETPVDGRDVLLGAYNPTGANYDLSLSHGSVWDSNNNEFSEQQYRLAGANIVSDHGIQPDAPVTYWFQRRETGFVLAVQSDRGWHDGFGWIGYEQIDHFWNGLDISSDDRTQPAGIVGNGGTRGTETDFYKGWGRAPYGWGGNAGIEQRSGTGQLITNTDGADFYAYTPVIWRANFPENSDGYGPPLGKTEPLWLHDGSGVQTAHRDVVETEGGAETFQVLKRQGIAVAIRAD